VEVQLGCWVAMMAAGLVEARLVVGAVGVGWCRGGWEWAGALARVAGRGREGVHRSAGPGSVRLASTSPRAFW
jgi:hypothetical protein